MKKTLDLSFSFFLYGSDEVQNSQVKMIFMMIRISIRPLLKEKKAKNCEDESGKNH